MGSSFKAVSYLNATFTIDICEVGNVKSYIFKFHAQKVWLIAKIYLAYETYFLLTALATH